MATRLSIIREITWTDVKAIVSSGSLELLGRSAQQQSEYDSWRAQNRLEWQTIGDFILVTKFGQTMAADPVSNKKIAVSTSHLETRVIISENDFPYNFEAGILHFIIWKNGTALLSTDEIEESLRQILKMNPAAIDSAVYVNPPHLKSIPDIDHAHVLILLGR